MARELAPVGPRSGPSSLLKRLGLLRSPAGASSLATFYGVFTARICGAAFLAIRNSAPMG
ncbi:hypothetical protein QCBJ_03765 [Pseudomonas sp. QC2]|nr:hypothetical protein QCBJ_03765 [Pseudomonas sp. QC2]